RSPLTRGGPPAATGVLQNCSRSRPAGKLAWPQNTLTEAITQLPPPPGQRQGHQRRGTVCVHASLSVEQCLGYRRRMTTSSAARRPAPNAANIAPVAALMADPARAAMIEALVSGPALASGELGQIAGVSPA